MKYGDSKSLLLSLLVFTFKLPLVFVNDRVFVIEPLPLSMAEEEAVPGIIQPAVLFSQSDN